MSINKQHSLRREFVCSLISIFSISLFCIVLIMAGVVDLSVKCYSIDSEGNLYIGIHKEIDVYSNGELIRSFSPKTSRDYVFTIRDDEILLSTPTYLFRMDLYGNVIESGEDKSGGTFFLLQANKYKIVLNQDHYELKGILGWTKIVKNDTQVVYRISGLSFTVKMVLYLTVLWVVLLFVRVLFVVCRRSGDDPDTMAGYLPWE